MSTWMVYAAVVTLLMGGSAWVLERATRDLGVPSRWIWAAALLGSSVLPVVALLVRAERLAVSPTNIEAASQAAPTDGSAIGYAPDAGASATNTFQLPGLRLPATPVLPARLDPFALIAWGLLSVALLAGLARAVQAVRRARSTWTAARVDGRDLLVSEGIGPAVVGVLRPDIVVPRWALDLSPRDRELMLRHEDEHRRAGDVPLLTGAVLLAVLLPWNLPIWWQLRRLRLAVEVDCDRRVLRGSRDLRRYAALLVDIGSRRASPMMSLALAAPTSFLERRIRAMTHPPQPRFVRIAGLAVAALVLAVVAGLLDRPVARTAAAEEPGAVSGERAVAPGSAIGRGSDPQPPVASQAAADPTIPEQRPEAPGSSQPNTPASSPGDAQSTGSTALEPVRPDESAAADVTARTDQVGAPAEPVASQIRGLVTDSELATPIAGARVFLAGTNLASISTEAGAYALPNVAAGTHELRVERVGYASATRVVALSDGAVLETNFALVPEVPTFVNVVAGGASGEGRTRTTMARITGRATDAASGAPLSDVQVYLVGANIGAITRATGAFVILNVPAGIYTVRAERIGLTTVSREVIVDQGDQLTIDFRMSPALGPGEP